MNNSLGQIGLLVKPLRVYLAGSGYRALFKIVCTSQAGRPGKSNPNEFENFVTKSLHLLEQAPNIPKSHEGMRLQAINKSA